MEEKSEEKVQSVEEPTSAAVEVTSEKKPKEVSPEPVVETVTAEEVTTPKSMPSPTSVPVAAPAPAPAPSPASAPKPTQAFVTHYNAGKKLFNAQNFEGALEEFDKAIEVSPEGNSQLKTLIYSRASCLRKLVGIILSFH